MPTRNKKRVRETFCNLKLFVGNQGNDFQILLLLPAEVSQWFLRGTIGHGASCPPSRGAAPPLSVSYEKGVFAVLSHSAVSDFLQPSVDRSLPGSSVHRDSPGENTGVGCHALSRGSSQSRDRT